MAPCCRNEASSSESLGQVCIPYLSPEDRYEVWLVKSVERPELLHSQSEQSNDDSLPMTDGCDIEGWRLEGIVPVNDSVQAVLHVGPGCQLLRRESQIPLLSTVSLFKWVVLQRKLLTIDPCRTPKRIPCTPEMSTNPWFERDNVPVVLDGCVRDWKAMESCTFQRLVERFGHLPWRFSDTHGETMSLRLYQKYLSSLEGSTDDAPLAIYDSQFGQDERRCIVDEYQIPSCFRNDLFELLPEDHRPPYRWILIGPARSGTGLHIDPVGTHAWVTLVQGLKRWVLFPAGTTPESIHMQDPQIPSVIWFHTYYDTVMAAHPNAMEVLQYPGETVYVPAGWPHLVLNLELSTAITHNYATEFPSLNELLAAVQTAEPTAATLLHESLRLHRPDLLFEDGIIYGAV